MKKAPKEEKVFAALRYGYHFVSVVIIIIIISSNIFATASGDKATVTWNVTFLRQTCHLLQPRFRAACDMT